MKNLLNVRGKGHTAALVSVKTICRVPNTHGLKISMLTGERSQQSIDCAADTPCFELVCSDSISWTFRFVGNTVRMIKLLIFWAYPALVDQRNVLRKEVCRELGFLPFPVQCLLTMWTKE